MCDPSECFCTLHDDDHTLIHSAGHLTPCNPEVARAFSSWNSVLIICSISNVHHFHNKTTIFTLKLYEKHFTTEPIVSFPTLTKQFNFAKCLLLLFVELKSDFSFTLFHASLIKLFRSFFKRSLNATRELMQSQAASLSSCCCCSLMTYTFCHNQKQNGRREMFNFQSNEKQNR